MTEQNWRKACYHIRDLGDGKRAIWTKIGSAFVNKDGSMNVILDCLPMDGRIHIKEERKCTTKKSLTL